MPNLLADVISQKKKKKKIITAELLIQKNQSDQASKGAQRPQRTHALEKRHIQRKSELHEIIDGSQLAL